MRPFLNTLFMILDNDSTNPGTNTDYIDVTTRRLPDITHTTNELRRYQRTESCEACISTARTAGSPRSMKCDKCDAQEQTNTKDNWCISNLLNSKSRKRYHVFPHPSARCCTVIMRHLDISHQCQSMMKQILNQQTEIPLHFLRKQI